MHALREAREPNVDPDVLDRFQFQCDLFGEGFGEVQSQIRSLDELLFRIKAGVVTLWAALVGWAIQSDLGELLLLGFAVIGAFWLLEGLLRSTQLRYIARSRELSSFANDTAALDAAFRAREFPSGIVCPVGLSDGPLVGAVRFAKGLVSSPVLPLYLMLALANTCLWLAAPLFLEG